MSRLRDTLIDQYASHYARGKTTLDPVGILGPLERQIDLTYGAFIDAAPAGSRVLDLGCGTGYLLSWLGRRTRVTATGVDSSPAQTAIARHGLPDVDIVCDDARAFLLRNPSAFAVIFCLDVLEHIPGDQLLPLMEAAQAALSPGGCFVGKTPNAANLTAAQLRYIDLTHERSFTESSLLQLFTAAGLGDCRVVPIQVAHASGRARLALERALHRAIFRICGDTHEQVFTRTISMAGYAPR